MIPLDNDKFIMALQEKLSYDNSIDRCERFGFKKTFLWPIFMAPQTNESAKPRLNPWKILGLQIHLAEDANEQKFVNSLASYSSIWLRIQFGNNQIFTDDGFRGMTGHILDPT